MGSLAQNSSGVIRCSCNTRFRRRFRRVPDPSGADGWWGSEGFRCRWLMRFRRVSRQIVPEGSGADGWWGSGGFRCKWLMRLWRVPGQIADEVPEGSSADSRQGSGGFRGRKLRLMRFRQVPGQMADDVPESSGQIAKNSPRSSKLLGITHEFIFFPTGPLAKGLVVTEE